MAVLVIVGVWNQSKYASAGNLLNKLQDSHTVEYYVAVKKERVRNRIWQGRKKIAFRVIV